MSTRKDKSLIQGLILTYVGDAGPEIVSNLSDIADENALITSLHLVSLAGLEEDVDIDSSKMIGPLPVKGTPHLKSLYYSDNLIATGAMDERLKMHGAKVGVVLLFDTDQLPEIRRAAGLIEPYLKLYLNKINETSELTQDFAIKLRDHIIDLVSRPRLRIFWIENLKLFEYKDPGFVKSSEDVILIDEEDRNIYILAQKETSPFTKNKIRNKINELNFELYKGGYTIVTLESFGEIEPLLRKHNVKVT
ncbi:MAG: hypothetical protein GPJ54_18520 [Candidatus Heimdallarchaeota archaeon]|nr:hypothetical protein [Candidatus Heimdallarchaeota archaeon]